MRDIYQHRQLFNQQKIRNLHLGIDLTVPVDTPVASPLAAIVHSFKDNQALGDYGPTIILQHQLNKQVFYTLYGHLARASLQHMQQGRALAIGEVFAHVGDADENGAWVPHLHFQIIEDIGDYYGDYPGVCAANEKEHYLQNCPDPNLILRLKSLS